METFRLDIAETEDLQTLAMISNGIVVATSSVRIDTLDEPVSIIQNLAVDSKYKRMGFGAIALNAAEKFILDSQTSNGLKIAKLDPTEPSIPFYARMGYAPISDDSGFWAKVIS